MDPQPLYLQLSGHYRQAIHSGVLLPGQRMPSVRALTRLHQVSLSTAVQACHRLEDEGWLEARPRSGYFVLKRRSMDLAPLTEPEPGRTLDPAQYVGIHDRVSDYVSKCERYPLTHNLAAAYCAPEMYPAEALKNEAVRALRQQPHLLVSAVAASGDSPLHAVLARRALAQGMQLSSDDIVVTHGCIEALNIALRAVTLPGDTVAVESPSYYGLLQVLESLGLRALEIPTSPTLGISVEALELAFQTQQRVKAVVVMPNLHNPLGCVMRDGDKERLVRLCERQQVALIEDDTYGALGADDVPLKAAKAWDRHGYVIYCASLRKTLAPGLRLGWMTGGRWHARIQMLKYAQSRSNEALAQIAVAKFMGSSAYDRHLSRLRRQLNAQREQTADAIAASFPAGTRLTVPRGSMMLWVELPSGTSASAVFDAALLQGIRVAPGAMFSNSSRYDHFLRISCGYPFTKEAADSLRTLAAITAQHVPKD
ncbi:transcriptional regulator, GntR family [Polaromonas sp. OV174]|uniref:aminotransferase-like domain-containing protein n=1 Tax=Polaromonas sp. OV174 TaxID=1855300 RepID=UPI0008DFCBF9|nr:PLP-dependent aminotransferase family protein [Polaromonas sp. OV174]SFC39654.1 transcriptional regulator, GntR family [Polaromonas sp. OV174]